MLTKAHRRQRFRFGLAGLFVLLTIAGLLAYCARTIAYRVDLKNATASRANKALSDAGFGWRIPDEASSVNLHARTITGWESTFEVPQQQFLEWCADNKWTVANEVMSEAELSRHFPGYLSSSNRLHEVWRFSNVTPHQKGGVVLVYDRHRRRAWIRYTLR